MTCVWKIKIEKNFLYIMSENRFECARKVIFINDSAILYTQNYKHLHTSLVEPTKHSIYNITLFCHYLNLKWIRQNA